jgi:hypothetical protein
VRRLSLLLVLLCLLSAGVARAQSASFTVAQHGHPVGTASFTFTAAPTGYSSASVVHVTMQGLNYALSKTERLTSANHLKHVALSATVNGSAVTVVVAPGNGKVLLNTSANGQSTTTDLPPHAAAVFLPDFDPGALQTLLALALEQNSRDLWAIIPKGKASVVPVQLATYADMHGTLNGKPIAVHHLVATIRIANQGAKTELFSGPENQLLQAELPQEGFALVRKGFVLQPPSKAPAPPPQPQTPPIQQQPQG